MHGFRRLLLLLAAPALLAACGDRGLRAPAADPRPVSVLVFGDHGYSTRYLEQKFIDRPLRTRADFEEFHRAWWETKMRPMSDFRVPQIEFDDATGGWVPASGMMTTAEAMKDSCDRQRCDFAVMLGDNIYQDGATLGADGVDDATRFRDLFELPLSALGANADGFLIYSILGNHDWHTSREGAFAQVRYLEQSDKFYMDGIYYSVVPEAGEGSVEIFVVDSEMLLSSTDVLKAKLNPDGSEQAHDELIGRRASAVPRTESEKRMVDWLHDSLRDSGATWKIVLAHHPMWSAGGEKFEQARAIRRLLRPAVCEYAHVYLAGHEHTLELYEDSCDDVPARRPQRALIQIVSGAAGKLYDLHHPYMRAQDAAYPQRRLLYAVGGVWGFARMDILGRRLEVEFFTISEQGGRAELAYRRVF